jgi:hypothetical protein
MSNKPTLYAYAVKDRGRGQKSIWTRIGAVWPHENGKGFTIELEAFPINGRLVLTEPKNEGMDKPADTFEGDAAQA